MHIGCPKEIKPQEFRVGLTPAAAQEAVANGHTVTVETAAGMGAGFTDEEWRRGMFQNSGGSALALFVLGVGANDHDLAVATDHPALVTHFFH